MELFVKSVICSSFIDRKRMMEQCTMALNLHSHTLHLIIGSLLWTGLSANTSCNAKDVKDSSDLTPWIFPTMHS